LLDGRPCRPTARLSRVIVVLFHFSSQTTVWRRLTCYTKNPARDCETERVLLNHAARSSTMRPDQPSEHDEPTEEQPPRLPDLPVYDPEEAALPDPDLDDDDDETENEDDLDDDLDEEDLLEDESLPEAIEAEPRTVLITGACGNVGRKLRAAWDDVYDLVLIDKTAPADDPDVIYADLSVLDDDWITHFHGVDTVVHLAANGNEFASWEELIGPNLDVLANVFHAAALAGVERLIFASSNHVMGQYQSQGDEQITVEMTPMPDGPYAVTKLVGERLGRSLARAFDMTVIALRLGWIQEGKNRPETLPHHWARQMWLSNADLVRLFDCAVEAEIEDRSFVLVNGMSRNHGTRWDLSDAAELLGFLPEDDAFAEIHRAVEGGHRDIK
jgi:NAD+ dependent glucose-6-phosphate dehydrogenase